LKGKGDNIRLACDKLCVDMPRLEGQGVSEGPQPVALRRADYTAAHLKSYGDDPGNPETYQPKGKTSEISQRNSRVFL